jgi:Leucine-rich repeat (LRR) protein
VPTIEALDAGYAQVTDVGLDHLASLPNLKELMIGGNKLTDVGLQALRQLRGLTRLDLSGVQRTDSGLWSVSLTELGVDAIATLSQVRDLQLGGMSVSARSLEKLKSLARLERLGLQGCRRVGDDAVPVLASWSTLKVVDLKGTSVTEQGLAELKKARPGTLVFHGPWAGPRMTRFE